MLDIPGEDATEGSSGTDSGSSTDPVTTDTGSDSESASSTTVGQGNPMCGNGVIDPGEECDRLDLGGASCKLEGLPPGLLTCDATCSLDTSGCGAMPGTPSLSLSFSAIKHFDFSWAAVPGANHYLLEQRLHPGGAFTPLGGPVMGESVSHTMPLHLRREAGYRVLACNDAGCTPSSPVNVMDPMTDAVGYFKAAVPKDNDQLGRQIVLSADGNTMAVTARTESSNAVGIDGNPDNLDGPGTGAVYVFARDGAGLWAQQAYIKASNPDWFDEFGRSVSISADGNTLAVSAHQEDGGDPGVGADQLDDTISGAGAVYVFVRDGMGQWSQQEYIKASNPGQGDGFGTSVALSGDGGTLAVGAPWEQSNASGINGDQTNDFANDSGATYVFVRDPAGQWSQQAYVKSMDSSAQDRQGTSVALSDDGDMLAVGASGEQRVHVYARDGAQQWSQQTTLAGSNTDSFDQFAAFMAMSGDGSVIAVAAPFEQSSATGIDGDEADDMFDAAGAVYVFERDPMGPWMQAAYVKATNTDWMDEFGFGMALSRNGSVLAVGARFEDGASSGVGGDEADDSLERAGAVYVYTRSEVGPWSPEAYVKAKYPETGHRFGIGVALDEGGDVLAVGAHLETSDTPGIGGVPNHGATRDAGAVYLY